MFLCLSVCLYVCMKLMYVCLFVCTCVRMYVYMHVYMYLCMCIQKCIYTLYVYTYSHRVSNHMTVTAQCFVRVRKNDSQSWKPLCQVSKVLHARLPEPFARRWMRVRQTACVSFNSWNLQTQTQCRIPAIRNHLSQRSSAVPSLGQTWQWRDPEFLNLTRMPD